MTRNEKMDNKIIEIVNENEQQQKKTRKHINERRSILRARKKNQK